jgi:hypothetical protein
LTELGKGALTFLDDRFRYILPHAPSYLKEELPEKSLAVPESKCVKCRGVLKARILAYLLEVTKEQYSGDFGMEDRPYRALLKFLELAFVLSFDYFHQDELALLEEYSDRILDEAEEQLDTTYWRIAVHKLRHFAPQIVRDGPLRVSHPHV